MLQFFTEQRKFLEFHEQRKSSIHQDLINIIQFSVQWQNSILEHSPRVNQLWSVKKLIEIDWEHVKSRESHVVKHTKILKNIQRLERANKSRNSRLWNLFWFIHRRMRQASKRVEFYFWFFSIHRIIFLLDHRLGSFIGACWLLLKRFRLYEINLGKYCVPLMTIKADIVDAYFMFQLPTTPFFTSTLRIIPFQPARNNSNFEF